MGRRRIVLRGALVVVAFGVAYVLLVFVQVTREASAAQGRSATGEAIVVLGAAQYDGEPSSVFAGRLTTAMALWQSGAAPLIVTTGSNQPGDTFTEGFAGFQFLRNEGVDEASLVVVVDGGDTYESLLATANQLDPDARRVILVTDPYHARRSKETAAEVGLDATVVAAGNDASFGRRARETMAVAIGRVIGFRRLSRLS